MHKAVMFYTQATTNVGATPCQTKPEVLPLEKTGVTLWLINLSASYLFPAQCWGHNPNVLAPRFHYWPMNSCNKKDMN